MRALVVYVSMYGNTRAVAEAAGKAGSTVALEEGAGGPGLREWLSSLGHLNVLAASFDTRVKGPAVFTGRASKGIIRELDRHGVHWVADPESFFVTKENVLEGGEESRALRWGEQLAALELSAGQAPAAT